MFATRFAFLLSGLMATVFGTIQFSLTVIPSNQPIYLGQKVVLTCQLKGIKTPINYAVLFKRKDDGISERCLLYDEFKYQLECDPNDPRRATTYRLHIKSASWTDRGDWFCVYAASLTQQRLLVYAPAELKMMQVAGLGLSASLQESQTAAHDDQKNGLAGPASSQLHVEAPSIKAQPLERKEPAPQAPLPQQIGLGTRTNPYDLRRGFGLKLTCETTCGYPDANITWMLLNDTSSKPGRTTDGPNKVRSDICNRSESTATMTMTTSTLEVDCVRSDLVGLNEVQCAVSGAQYKDHIPTRYVYVLCPGEEPSLQLMQGEVVGIAVGAAVALILIFIFCIVVRKSRKQSPLSPTLGHFLGHRV